MVQLGSADTVTETDIPSLLWPLQRVPDPRIRRGRRHPLAYVLALAACAVLAGARSLTAIAEWAADLPRDRPACTGARVLDPEHGLACRPPSEAAFRRVLQRLDGDALDTAISSSLRERAHHQPEKKELVQVAVDGKALRGAVRPDGSQVHLISALRMDGVVLAQREVPSKTNESPLSSPSSPTRPGKPCDHLRCPVHPDRSGPLPRRGQESARHRRAEGEPTPPAPTRQGTALAGRPARSPQPGNIPGP
ncbi:transposase family protein [Streptomyces griseofuscus]|uniref:transposase family protein n=1 Tax=Streptomyces griseofuscus TaxID=146922 RepID=UPI0034565E72